MVKDAVFSALSAFIQIIYRDFLPLRYYTLVGILCNLSFSKAVSISWLVILIPIT